MFNHWTFAELLYCFCILLIKGCSIETGVQSPHWMWKENYSGAISFIHGCGGDGKGKQMIGCVGNKGKCWQGGKTVKKCHKHQMYLPKLFNVQGKAGKWKERQEKCDKTKKCSQVRWKWYKNYALCTPHDYCSFHLKVNRLTHVTWRHMFSYFSLLCLAS